VQHIERVTLSVVHSVPHRDCYSMAGPWYGPLHAHRESYTMGGPLCALLRSTLWVAHCVPHRESYTMGGPLCAP